MSEHDASSIERQRDWDNDPSWHKTLKSVGALSCLSGAILAGVSLAQGEYVLASGFTGMSVFLGNTALKEAQAQTKLELEYPENGD